MQIHLLISNWTLLVEVQDNLNLDKWNPNLQPFKFLFIFELGSKVLEIEKNKIAKTKIASLEKIEQPGSKTDRRTYWNFSKVQNQDKRFIALVLNWYYLKSLVPGRQVLAGGWYVHEVISVWSDSLIPGPVYKPGLQPGTRPTLVSPVKVLARRRWNRGTSG